MMGFNRHDIGSGEASAKKGGAGWKKGWAKGGGVVKAQEKWAAKGQ